MTHNVLAKIIKIKNDEIIELKSLGYSHFTNLINQTKYNPASFYTAVKQSGTLALIAELKKASPSRGIIRHGFNPGELALEFEQKGAKAISVLTEKHLFLGDPDYVSLVKSLVKIPVLRKDFIFEPIQIYESKALGADAILLIKALLSNSQLQDLLNLANELSLDVLLEIHSQQELDEIKNLKGIKIVGVNNRDLNTLEVNINLARELFPMIKNNFASDVAIVAESGYKERHELEKLKTAGFNAVLIGEGLINDPFLGIT